MGIGYLQDQPWSDWTREERFFCAILFSHARQDPAAFARWLIGTTGLKIEADGEWDLGYEVCFYRDYLWQQGGSAKHQDLPAKRTFDLCLFGERDLIVIEAKVCEAYTRAQNDDFAHDKARIARLSGMEGIGVLLVALASSRYFANADRYGRAETLEVFEGHPISWQQLADHYGDEFLGQADGMYKLRPSKAGRRADAIAAASPPST
jgi:hypothetical protein